MTSEIYGLIATPYVNENKNKHHATWTLFFNGIYSLV
jgi:hypothetical protein